MFMNRDSYMEGPPGPWYYREVRVTTPVHVFIFTEYLTLGAMVTLYH